MNRLLLPFFLLLVIGPRVSAARTEFLTVHDGKRLAGSTVCFFPATRNDGFFQKFLSFTDVRCLSADAVIDMPLGNWNAFLENGEAFTSVHPEFQFGDEESAAAKHGYRAVRVEMLPAAKLAFDPVSEAGVRPVVYFPNLDVKESPASIRPLNPGRDWALVPAGTPVVPLLVRGTTIVRVGEPVTLEPGMTERATFPPAATGRRDVIVLLRAIGDYEEGEAPTTNVEVSLQTAAGTVKPLLPVPAGLQFDRSLAIFRGVPTGAAKIVATGTGWSTQTADVPPAIGPVQVLPDAIQIGQRAEVLVEWSVPAVKVTASCFGGDDQDAFVATIARCAGNRCDVVQEVKLDATAERGTFVVKDLSGGSFRAALHHPNFGMLSKVVTLTRGRVEKVMLDLQPVRITGTVKKGDDAMRAVVQFATGTTTTDETGEYTALLAAAPSKNTVTVRPCDGSAPYLLVPSEALVDGARYDIELPDTKIDVAVTDAQTGAPVNGALINAAVLFAENDDEWFYLDTPLTDKEGKIAMERVSPDLWLKVCASHRDYQQKCEPSFRLGENQHKTLAFALAKHETKHGRIVTNGPIQMGRLYWIAATGAVTEMRPVDEDGSFLLTKPHTPDEHVVFTAVNHSLYALRAPLRMDQETIEIALPVMPIRSVNLAPQSVDNARLALEVDGLIVPENVFHQHQAFRRAPSAIHGKDIVPIRDIAARDLVVLVGPRTDWVPAGAPRDADLAGIPQYRALFRRYFAVTETIAVD